MYVGHLWSFVTSSLETLFCDHSNSYYKIQNRAQLSYSDLFNFVSEFRTSGGQFIIYHIVFIFVRLEYMHKHNMTNAIQIGTWNYERLRTDDSSSTEHLAVPLKKFFKRDRVVISSSDEDAVPVCFLPCTFLLWKQ